MNLMTKNIYILFFLILFTSLCAANEIFVSLKKNKVNVRYGPSFESDIKYVYKKINLPLKQIDKKENFRRIIDLKNNSGWIHISQLKKSNSVIATHAKGSDATYEDFAHDMTHDQKKERVTRSVGYLKKQKTFTDWTDEDFTVIDKAITDADAFTGD